MCNSMLADDSILLPDQAVVLCSDYPCSLDPRSREEGI